MRESEQYPTNRLTAQSAGYGPFTDLAGASPHEAEILAFGLCNSRMASAKDPVARIEALNKNQQLWTTLVRDLASEANLLPNELKTQLIDLGFWSMRYGVVAMGQALPLDPLIAVNRNILEGLKAQRAGAVSHIPTPPRRENAMTNGPIAAGASPRGFAASI